MRVLIAGATGALGAAWVEHCLAQPDCEEVVATWHQRPPERVDPRLRWVQVDLADEAAVAALATQVTSLDRVIVAAGRLHGHGLQPEKSVRQLGRDPLMAAMLANTVPTLLLAQALQPALRHGRPAHFAALSAKVGSIEDNRLGGWYSYRASKAALNMILKTLAIEWRRTAPRVIVSALHPGTVVSSLSEPFIGATPEERRFTAAYSVACQAAVLERLQPEDSGGFWSWNGERLPW